MKKLFMFLFSVSMLALAGCADEGGSSSQVSQTGEQLFESEFIGQYKIDFFSIRNDGDGSNSAVMVSDNCTQALQNISSGISCDNVTILEQRVDIQPHSENGMNILSFIAQMQLGGDNITKEGSKITEYAYDYLLFPVQLASAPVEPSDYFDSKATSRGLTNFIISKPYGDAYNKNVVVNYFYFNENKLDVAITTIKAPNIVYKFQLTKTSPNSMNYVRKTGNNNIETSYAVSDIFNQLINTYTGDTTFEGIFSQFIDDLPNN